YQLPLRYQVDFYWRGGRFYDNGVLLPFLTILVFFVLLRVIINLFFFSLPRKRPTPSLFLCEKLGFILIMTMALSLVDWLINIKLVGGLEAFLLSHWYERGELLVTQLGDSFVLLVHFGMANQVIFMSAAVLYTGLALQRLKIRKWLLSLTIF